MVVNVSTVHRQAGCATGVRINPALRLAAQWHANDVLTDRTLDGNLGSDGSTLQSRSQEAGFTGAVAQSIAVNPALAINNLEVLRQWYYDPKSYAIMAYCA